MIHISPSLLACNFACLGSEVSSVENAGVDYVHVDVMDGVFVPNISIGFPIIKCLKSTTKLTLDVHAMIIQPSRYLKQFKDSGTNILTIHCESEPNCADVLRDIKKLDMIPSIAVKPSTPIEEIYPLLPLVKMVLVMTVEPGFGGQALIPCTLEKIRKLRAKINSLGLNIDIQADGGINMSNIQSVFQSGVNVFVLGTAIFAAQNRQETVFQISQMLSQK